MAVGDRETNTFEEGLKKILGDLASLKIEPDADLPFVLHIEQEVVSELRAPIDNANAAGLSNVPSGPPPGAGGPPVGPFTPGGPPQGPPNIGPQGPPQVPGLSQAPGPIPPELARLLGQGPTSA